MKPVRYAFILTLVIVHLIATSLFGAVAYASETSMGRGGDSRTEPAGSCALPASQKDAASKANGGASGCFAKSVQQELKKNSGQKPQGECLREVRQAFEKVAGASSVPWCQGAADAGKCLRDLGMVPAWSWGSKSRPPNSAPVPKLTKKEGRYWSVEWPMGENWGSYKIKKVKNEFGAESDQNPPCVLPPGAVLVYGGTNEWGHIEVVTDDGQVCYDGCSGSLRSEQTQDRWLIGVYLPPPGAYKGCQQQSPWGQNCADLKNQFTSKRG